MRASQTVAEGGRVGEGDQDSVSGLAAYRTKDAGCRAEDRGCDCSDGYSRLTPIKHEIACRYLDFSRRARP
jgi:hypothetical protein